MRNYRSKKYPQRGDTIIEVLVALAILSFAIILSYTSANRSLAYSRQALNNSVGAEYAQTQIEAIRSDVVTSTASNNDTISKLATITSSSVQFCIMQGVLYLFSVTPASCQITNGGTTYTVIDTLDKQPITAGADLTNVNLFKAQVIWPDEFGHGSNVSGSIGGYGSDTVTLFYRAYPPVQPT
ncbi:MAG: hypothetical protein ACHQT9_01455 [Candidatus Saccharimonadales bacterium]